MDGNAIAYALLAAGTLLARAGLALAASGMVRSKNAAGAVGRSLLDACVAVLVFWGVGAAVASLSAGRILDLRGEFGGEDLFIAVAVLLATGPAVAATAERSRIYTLLVAPTLLAGVIAPLSLRLSVWLRVHDTGVIDVAGAGWLHWVGGLVAAVAVAAVGPRTGKYNRDGSANVIPGHNVTFVALGALVMLVAWIPYVTGFSLAWGLATRAPADVVLAAAAGGAAAAIYTRLRYAKPDIYLIGAGLLGGLVSITAGGGMFSTLAAVTTGAVAGAVVPFVLVLLDLRFRLDDAGGLVAVHAVGGLWGLVAVALLGGQGLRLGQRLGQTGVQLLDALILGVLAVVVSAPVYLACRATFGLRPSEEAEYDGLDLVEHDLNAYPDFQQTMIKSYHLREA